MGMAEGNGSYKYTQVYNYFIGTNQYNLQLTQPATDQLITVQIQNGSYSVIAKYFSLVYYATHLFTKVS